MIYPYFIAPLVGFFFGSLPVAWTIVKLVTGKDVRSGGSGSVSTRNTVRMAGWGWAILTAALDVTKGFLAAFLTRFFIFPEATHPGGDFPHFELIAALAGIGAFAGHCWMPWMKFKGGKGFAVLSGTLIVINPYGLPVWWLSLPLWLIIIRYSGVSGIMATACVAILGTIFYLTGATAWNTWPVMVHGWGCTLLIILRMIPDFIGMKKGEIKRWGGMRVSNWMK